MREASGRSRDRRHAVDSNDCSPPFPWRSSERRLLGSYRSWPIVIVPEHTQTATVSVLSQASPGSSCISMSVQLIRRLGNDLCSRSWIVTSYDGTLFVRIACYLVLGWKHDSLHVVALCVRLVHVGGDSP